MGTLRPDILVRQARHIGYLAGFPSEAGVTSGEAEVTEIVHHFGVCALTQGRNAGLFDEARA